MEHNKKKALFTNLIFAGVLVLLALVFWLVLGRRPAAGVAVLTYGSSNQRMELSLDKDETYHIDTGYLTVNIQVKDGAARFVNSPCPDHLCENFGWLSKDGDTATCLPGRASLMVLEKT